MTDFADRWKDEWNDLPEDMREFAIGAGPTDTQVLLLGEPGSGKGYLARILHDLSPRADGPFVSQNCGVFTESLAEAKLFGYVKGAYTGATDSRAGLVEAAAGGTLFLDELGALPLAVQPMLLTFLETGEFRLMGSTSVRRVDVRVIAATNRDLSRAIAKDQFREDLVGRLSPRYEVPPLRERRREKTLIAVFAVVMAAAMWPAPASAQYPYPEGCGWCMEKELEGDLGLHHMFKGAGLNYRCNTNMGCHYNLWYPDKCNKEHSPCFITMTEYIESAIVGGDYPQLEEVLASSDNWDYDPASHALSFTCSGYTVARYVLPEELRHAVDLLRKSDQTEARLQEPGGSRTEPRSWVSL